MQRRFLYSYMTILTVGVILLLTGYSFSLKPLNYLFIVSIVFYPVVRFFLSGISLWLKVVTSLLVLFLIGVIGSYALPFLAFASSDVKFVEKWHVKGYRIVLERRLDWAGPSYYRYELHRTRLFGLLDKTIGYAYAGTEVDTSCKIKFSETNSISYSIEFDKCQNSINKAN